MFQIENEYETSKKSKYYQNKNTHFQNPNKTQKTTDYTKQELIGSSSTNNIYQNTFNKVQLFKQKNWTIPLLLENPKSKDFQSPGLEIEF